MSENSEKFKEAIEHIKETRKPIGKGAEKLVYLNPDNNRQVIGSYHGKEGRVGNIKASFYLTKILHLLFPKNIPDIHQVTAIPKTITRQRIETDSLHKDAQRDDSFGWEARVKLKGKLDQNSEYKRFRDTIYSLGVNLDTAPLNFSLDPEDNPVYLDDFKYWDHDVAEKLQKAIEHKLQEPERTRALKFLERFRELDQQ